MSDLKPNKKEQILSLIENQACNENLWCPETVMEAYVIAALRELHRVIEEAFDE